MMFLTEKGFEGIRIVPDIHGMSLELKDILEESYKKKYYVIQLGDIIDRGYDNAGSLQQILDMKDEGLGDWIIGNHEWKHIRKYRGSDVRLNEIHLETQRQISMVDGLSDRLLKQVDSEEKFWLKIGNLLFAHGGYHRVMGDDSYTTKEVRRAKERALYGQTDGTFGLDGYPTRILKWVDDVPEDTIMFVGHHVLSTDHITYFENKVGSKVFFTDMGSGRDGGKLTYIDISFEDIEKMKFKHNTQKRNLEDFVFKGREEF